MTEALEDREEALRLHCLLHGLGEPYKEVFHLRVFGELPFGDIARVFGRTESWARVTFYRAKQKIIAGLELSLIHILRQGLSRGVRAGQRRCAPMCLRGHRQARCGAL